MGATGRAMPPQRILRAGPRLACGVFGLCAIAGFASATCGSLVAQQTNAIAKADAIGTTSAIAKTNAATTNTIAEDSASVSHIAVTRHKSRTIRLSQPFGSAVVGAPNIADVLPMSDRVLYIQGKEIGTTNISVFGKDKELIAIIDVDVTLDTEHIARSVRSNIDSPDIRVSTNGDQVVLSGTAKDAADSERAVGIAKAVAPKASVINAMRIGQPQQVMLKVRYLEVNRNAAREIGVNWYGANAAGNRGFNTGLGGPTTVGAGLGSLPLFRAASTFASGTTSEPFSVAIASILNHGFTLDMMISALEKKGLVRSLAEPDLVALSGEVAKFHAGGEIPVPTIQPGTPPTIATEYKPFGVELSFTPTVLNDGIINLNLHPKVSALDFTNAVLNEGFRIPALTKRETQTTIELRDGQSFAISGLLQNDGLRDISQLPWLGTVPILGVLFRSSSYQQRETELVVIVTPHLVAPAAPGQKLATPLDQRLPSNDIDFFLGGRMDLPKQYRDYVTKGGEVKGPYGHIIQALPEKHDASQWETTTWKP